MNDDGPALTVAEEELTRYWNLLRRWWWLPLLGVALAVGGAYIWSSRTTPVYQATTLLLVNQVQSPGLASYQDILSSQSLAKTYSQLVQSDTVLEHTIRQLNLPVTVDDLRGQVSEQVVGDSQLLRISVEDTDPGRARLIADGLAQSLIKRVQDLQQGNAQNGTQQIDRELADVRRQIAETTSRLNELRSVPDPATNTQSDIARLQLDLTQYENRYYRLLELQQQASTTLTQATNSILLAEPAHTAAAPIKPRTVRNLVLAALLGLILATGLALLLDYFDDRIRDLEEVRKRFDVTALATLGLVRGGPSGLRPETVMATSNEFSEAVRLLQTNLQYVALGNASIICISSATQGEGTTTVAANLALAEAQAGKRVLLIDANLRDPGLHHFFSLENRRGLSNYLVQMPSSDQIAFQDGPLGIMILTSGPLPPNPSELLCSQRMADLIAPLRSQADVIILDSAPLLPTADTLVLQRVIDGTLLVVDGSRTGTRTLDRALKLLRQSSGRVLGVVLNKDSQRRKSPGLGLLRRSLPV